VIERPHLRCEIEQPWSGLQIYHRVVRLLISRDTGDTSAKFDGLFDVVIIEPRESQNQRP
jgi:hypothetical protein